MPECKYCKKIFRTNKALEMHIFQVHERRGTKTDKVKFEWKKKEIIFRVLNQRTQLWRNKMKCPMISITREPQDCIEENCYFWDLGHSKCKWMSTKWKNGFAKNVDIQWHSMEDLNSYITATISFVNSIRHLWQKKDDKNE